MTDDRRLAELHAIGQSPWLDNLRRGWITGGELQRWIDRGVRGLTSNPSIFQKAISSVNDPYSGLKVRTCSPIGGG